MMNRMKNKRGMNTKCSNSWFDLVLPSPQKYDGRVTHVNDRGLVMVSILEEIEYHTIGQDIMLQHYEKGFAWGLKLVDSVQLSKNSILTLRRAELELFDEVDQRSLLEKGDFVKLYLLPFKQEYLPPGLTLTLAPSAVDLPTEAPVAPNVEIDKKLKKKREPVDAAKDYIELNAEEGKRLVALIQDEIDNEAGLRIEKLARLLPYLQLRSADYYPAIQGYSTQTTLFSRIDNVIVRTINGGNRICMEIGGRQIGTSGLVYENGKREFAEGDLKGTFLDMRKELKRAQRPFDDFRRPPGRAAASGAQVEYLVTLMDKHGKMLMERRKIVNALIINKGSENVFRFVTDGIAWFSGTRAPKFQDVSILLERNEERLARM